MEIGYVILLLAVISLYGLKQYYHEKFEADDIAATVVRKNPGKKILLATKDTDWFQMLRDNVWIMFGSDIIGKEFVI